jgi:hypothetical protein
MPYSLHTDTKWLPVYQVWPNPGVGAKWFFRPILSPNISVFPFQNSFTHFFSKIASIFPNNKTKKLTWLRKTHLEKGSMSIIYVPLKIQCKRYRGTDEKQRKNKEWPKESFYIPVYWYYINWCGAVYTLYQQWNFRTSIYNTSKLSCSMLCLCWIPGTYLGSFYYQWN